MGRRALVWWVVVSLSLFLSESVSGCPLSCSVSLALRPRERLVAHYGEPCLACAYCV